MVYGAWTVDKGANGKTASMKAVALMFSSDEHERNALPSQPEIGACTRG